MEYNLFTSTFTSTSTSMLLFSQLKTQSGFQRYPFLQRGVTIKIHTSAPLADLCQAAQYNFYLLYFLFFSPGEI